MIPLHRLPQHCLHFQPHVLGLQHLYFVALREQLLQKVEGGAQVELEVGMVFSLFSVFRTQTPHVESTYRRSCHSVRSTFRVDLRFWQK